MKKISLNDAVLTVLANVKVNYNSFQRHGILHSKTTPNEQLTTNKKTMNN